jgi:hypothetical protein
LPTRLGLPNITTWSTVKGRIMSGIGAVAATAILASQNGFRLVRYERRAWHHHATELRAG